jgi:chorismate synthase
MASNSFGNLFKITTWGESHGKAIGVVIDGCPAGISLNDEMINLELERRIPGKTKYTSPRKETDQAEILSGIFEGKTTGAPISILIWNRDVQSSQYESVKHLYKPGHANYTYLNKYGCFDFRGGGRSSARETACRVAAGAVAKQILSDLGVDIVAYLSGAGSIQQDFLLSDVATYQEIRGKVQGSSIFCPHQETESKIQALIEETIEAKDSIGGLIEAVAFNVPSGWGDPIYEKLEANLAKAMLSIPASKGFEIGCGFDSASMRGSVHNDTYQVVDQTVELSSNKAGGTLGGISTGMPIVIRVPFKPTSSIAREQNTATLSGEAAKISLPVGSRHDPCVAIRAVPVVEAMFALVLVDAMLMNKSVIHVKT